MWEITWERNQMQHSSNHLKYGQMNTSSENLWVEIKQWHSNVTNIKKTAMWLCETLHTTKMARCPISITQDCKCHKDKGKENEAKPQKDPMPNTIKMKPPKKECMQQGQQDSKYHSNETKQL